MLVKLAIWIQSLLKAVGNHTVALLKVLILSKFNVKLPRAGVETITVMANGPTLKEDLEIVRKLSSSEYMCVNFFVLTDLFDELKPKYYTLCDPVFFIRDPKHPLYERVMKFYRTLYQKTSWELYLFLPATQKRRFKPIIRNLGISNVHIHVLYYNTTNFEGHSWLIQSLYQHKLGIPSPTSIAIPALMLAIIMGYKQINLTGVSHDFHLALKLSDDNVLMMKLPHFYETEDSAVYKPFLKADRKTNYSMSELFMILHKMFRSYEFVASFAKRNNISIINFTANSFIDQFKKYKAS